MRQKHAGDTGLRMAFKKVILRWSLRAVEQTGHMKATHAASLSKVHETGHRMACIKGTVVKLQLWSRHMGTKCSKPLENLVASSDLCLLYGWTLVICVPHPYG